MTETTLGTRVDELLDRWDRRHENLLQILIGLQQSFLRIPPEAVTRVASELGCSRAQVEGVIEFYSFLHIDSRGRYQLRFADNIIEQMSGSRALMERLAARVGVAPGEIGDARASLAYTSCIGLGDQGPAALVNGRPLTRLTPERIDRIADLIIAEIPLEQWPPELFRVEENVRRQDLLLAAEPLEGEAITRALALGPENMLAELQASGLRGRGGAGFKTALKWRLCHEAPGHERVVVCNADEGEPGTFKDRVLLQRRAGEVFEGMTVCAATVGANRGFLYLRGEYLYLLQGLEAELQRRREAGLLGRDIGGRAGFHFDIEIHLGAGAYICGEESALLESLEGKRGSPRIRPPFPVTSGYLGRPTVVNNVETLVAAAGIAAHGAEWFRSRGTEESAGTKLLSVSGDCKHPGVYEVPFGVTVESVLAECGADDVQAVQLAGAAGRCLPPSEFGRSIAFEDLATGGSFMIFNQTRDLLRMVENFAAFFRHESCGFCTPCRVGTSQLELQLQKVIVGHATRRDIERMYAIGSLMRKASHCGLGQTAPNAILDTIEKFPKIYASQLRSTGFEPAFDLDASLQEARELTGRDDPGAHLTGGGV